MLKTWQSGKQTFSYYWQMKHAGVFILAVLPAIIDCYSQTGKSAMLPQGEDLPGWRLKGEPVIYDSKPAGALSASERDLILEFGLSYALDARYYHPGGSSVKVEVFTMNNSFGSCGMFLFYGKGSRTFRDYGNECYSRQGEFGFWKHLYFIRMSSENENDTVREGYKKIAGFIDSRIRTRGSLPDILEYGSGKRGRITLFRGPVALSEIYYFGPRNLFFTAEGLAIERENEKELYFRYPDNNEAVRKFTEVASLLSSIDRFSGFSMTGDFSFRMKDREGRNLDIEVDRRSLHVLIR